MSAWLKGKMKLKCSQELFKRAIINLMPQWESHIRTDPSGKLAMYRYHGAGPNPEQRKRKDITVNILIPGSGNPNYPTPPGRSADNDWGFFREADGTWTVHFADYKKAEAQNLANNVTAEVSRLVMELKSKLKGYTITKSTKEKGKAIIEMTVTEEQYKKFQQLAGQKAMA